MDPIVGASRILQATFRDLNGALVDPDVVLTIRDPEDDVTTPAFTNPSTGVFEHEVILDVVGIWYYEWEGSSVDGVEICDGSICVVASSVLVNS